MRMRFIAVAPNGVCQVFGHDFPQGEWVDDPGFTADEIARLKANPTFEVDDPPAPAAPADLPEPVE